MRRGKRGLKDGAVWRKGSSLAFCLILLFFCAAPLLAQTQLGTISGRLSDQSDAIVPEAKLVLVNLATNTKAESFSNLDGLYFFPNIIAGKYELTAEKQGFRLVRHQFVIEVAQRMKLDFKLEVGEVTQVVDVSDNSVAINTVSGELARTVSSREIMNLPFANLNPYNLVALAPAAANTGSVVGDVRGGGEKALGIAVGGARTASINFMLDGGENNDTFSAGVGQTIPLDSIQEFKVQTNNMTSEFGRNAVVANVITKSGTNQFHGSAYEYYRGAALSSTPFDDNANNSGKSNFVRNQFGASAGGPIRKDKTFFFGSFEGLKVRSSATARFYVPTTQFMSAASPETVNFLKAYGGAPSSDLAGALTAGQIVENMEGGSYADSPLLNANTGAPIPADTPLLGRTTVNVPIDAGGGAAQDTYLFTGRIDHQFTQNTSLFGRYAFTQVRNPVGSNSYSPYPDFNTGTFERDQNIGLTLTHAFSPRLASESRIVYNRVFQDQPLGKASGTSPCWYYDLQSSTPTGDSIVFPGYLPSNCQALSLPSGGPQNLYQFYHSMTYSRGKHTFKMGGQYVHMKENHTFGAFQYGTYDTFTMQGMLDGVVDFMYVAIDPKGKFPGEQYAPSTDGPFVSPNFTRHHRYNEAALFFEDSVKLTPRLTLTAGLRWEYFGVLHSPAQERFLDANIYLNAVGTADASKSVFEQVRDARFMRTNNFYQQDFNNFAPRFGLAYDIFGNGRTIFRGGYGLFYERNFGNVLFNSIQNFPNYATISAVPGGSVGGDRVYINVDQFATLGELMTGGSLALRGSGRMLNREMATAYSPQWNLTLEHDFFGKGIIGATSYLGSNGVKLYVLNNLNQLGSCALEPNANAVCTPGSTGVTSRLNQTGMTGMNRRANEGLSRYNAFTFEIRATRLGSTGLYLNSNYTWAHSIDNSSSTFGDSSFEGNFGFGFRDPYNPALDRASSSNDIRHRFVLSGTWQIPFTRNLKGASEQILNGWNISGIYQAQTGGAFTVYDGSLNSQCNNSGTNFCFPVITGPVPSMTVRPGDAPNSFVLYDNMGSTFQTHEDYCNGDLACTGRLMNLQANILSPRNLFRTPGYWNMDMSVAKDFRLFSEDKKLQFRADFFNMPNHANLYAVYGTNSYSGANSQVIGRRGVDPADRKDRRNIQLSLRFLW